MLRRGGVTPRVGRLRACFAVAVTVPTWLNQGTLHDTCPPTHGRHPPGTRLAAPPVADSTGAASAGIYAPSVDGRLWNRRLELSPECKAALVLAGGGGGKAPGATGSCGHNGKPMRSWLFFDMGAPKAAGGGSMRRLTCAPVAVMGASRLAALTRDGALAIVRKSSSGKWKWSLHPSPLADESLSTPPPFAGWVGEVARCGSSSGGTCKAGSAAVCEADAEKKTGVPVHDAALGKVSLCSNILLGHWALGLPARAWGALHSSKHACVNVSHVIALARSDRPSNLQKCFSCSGFYQSGTH